MGINTFPVQLSNTNVRSLRVSVKRDLNLRRNGQNGGDNQ